MSVVEASPLSWPAGWDRTSRPQRSRFDCTMGYVRDLIIDEIRKLGGRNPIISTDLRLRLDGLPYATQREPEDRGVAVYFEYKGTQVVFACDKWDRIRDNMRAIQKTIEAMRGVERWGVSDMLERAFMGFNAIPANVSEEKSWWIVLNCKRDVNAVQLTKAFRAEAKKCHPDKIEGEDSDRFIEITKAYEQGQAHYFRNNS